MSTTCSTLLAVPFLALVSLPLVFSAYITICLSVLTLFLRLLVIYVELCFAIVSNYFVIPTSSKSSLLSFASEPTTPAVSATPKRRSIDHGVTVILPHSSNHLQIAPFSRGHTRPAPARRRNSSNASTGHPDGDYGRPVRKEELRRNGFTTPPSALLTLVSGDEGRDFEGVGGWRCPPSAKSHGHLSRSASSSSKDSLSDEADERAWLSINDRLELPSQPFPLRNHPETADILPWRHSQAASRSPDGRRQRHHHRSATTSLIPSQTRRPPTSPSASRSNRSEFHLPAVSGARSRGLSPRPQSQDASSLSTYSDFFRAMASAPQTHSQLRLSSSAEAPGGYFAFRPGNGANSSGSVVSTGTTTPVEDRSSTTPRSMGRFMAHYPTGVRYRRRSVSGPNFGSQLPSPSLSRDRTF
ncbi:hypothetical protein IFM58399_03389 [Aspergillus lentulus]|uniref:Uncharacterized protein n=1 Tax=Aspergillus lentulus TaxID=293939 RepID=A0AAN6BLR3_ASPLE|nr:uncharacterized protein IFM58399_03389 [Aspergillus lentulus]KAF4167862.1 hypothetical protein CNMCM6936_004264 [Aspergillus lentulus]KAF4202290.1 hypothetical protein CNMCM8927_000483 [Aspergillus lentulus]GFF32988.1 hypothetical protein IFM58399_03389 [Aspergillus lentulus]GFF59472.1 hypothetical protein IFM62136_04191 [Aspergillus lentulus]GFF75532.1 hypothetical protein IFM60648_04471 [Aspergillus lentulus]